MAIPVGTSARWEAAKVMGSSMQAHRSMAAAPEVAKWGTGMSCPIRGESALIFSSIVTPFVGKFDNKL